jgi:hypothetical protein
MIADAIGVCMGVALGIPVGNTDIVRRFFPIDLTSKQRQVTSERGKRGGQEDSSQYPAGTQLDDASNRGP